MYVFMSEHKNNAVFAISPGVANRPSGTWRASLSISGLVSIDFVNSVEVKPGQSAFTRILNGARSSAMARVSPISPVLLAE